MFSVQPFLRNINAVSSAIVNFRKRRNQLCQFLMNLKLPIFADAKLRHTIHCIIVAVLYVSLLADFTAFVLSDYSCFSARVTLKV